MRVTFLTDPEAFTFSAARNEEECDIVFTIAHHRLQRAGTLRKRQITVGHFCRTFITLPFLSGREPGHEKKLRPPRKLGYRLATIQISRDPLLPIIFIIS